MMNLKMVMLMNKALNIIDKIIIVFASILLFILIGCLSVLPIAKSKSYYMKQHVKNDVVNILNEYTFTGMYHTQLDENNEKVTVYYPKHEVDMDVVEQATDIIIDYLYHKDVESMQFQIETDEGMVDFFTPQAIIHMKDVKVLFIGGINLAWISLVLFALCILYMIYRRQYVKKHIIKLYTTTIIAFVFILVGLFVFAAIDFDAAFTVFHYMIFNSADAELAISFSYYDTLTNVLTGEFFMNIGIIIGVTFIGLLVLSVVIGLLINKYGYKLLNLIKKEQTVTSQN